MLEAAKAKAINDFLTDKLLDQADPANNPIPKQVTMLEVLDRAAGEVGRSFAGQPEIEAAIRLAIWRIYHGLTNTPKGRPMPEQPTASCAIATATSSPNDSKR